jgi:hypothetical protein
MATDGLIEMNSIKTRRCEDPRCRAGIFMEQQPLP